MSENSLGSLFNSGDSFVRGLHDAARGNQISEQTVITNGIVIDINMEPNFDQLSSATIPQYSIKAKIIDDIYSDFSESENLKEQMYKWYSPLMSLHNLAIPEVGEEVLIIRSTTSVNSQGYWVARVNNTSWVNRKQYAEGLDINSVNGVGLGIDYTGLYEENEYRSPNKDKKRYGIPANLGDVIQQGRSGSFIRHSFNNKNKTGVLESGIMQNRLYSPSDLFITIGRTATKNIHIEKGLLSDLGSMKKITNVDFAISTPSGPRTLPDNNTPRSFIANMADETYLISLAPDAQTSLHRHVLGEKLVTYEENLAGIYSATLEKMSNFVTTVGNFLNHFLDHTHSIPEINIEIPDKEIEFIDTRREPDKLVPQPPKITTVPSEQQVVTTRQPERIQRNFNSETGNYEDVVIPSQLQRISINIPPKQVSTPTKPKLVPGALIQHKIKKKIAYEKITIGGEGKKRLTTSPETSQVTNHIDRELESHKEEISNQLSELTNLLYDMRDILSKRHYLN